VWLKIAMINELKKAIDDFLGNNGDERNEEAFICGWIGCPDPHGYERDNLEGRRAREKYDKE